VNIPIKTTYKGISKYKETLLWFQDTHSTLIEDGTNQTSM